jgi:hypothetical protein
MFPAPKPRGTDDNPFPARGMTGGEIVLGYRGMKEFDISFDGFSAGRQSLCGPRASFKQLMQTSRPRASRPHGPSAWRNRPRRNPPRHGAHPVQAGRRPRAPQAR